MIKGKTMNKDMSFDERVAVEIKKLEDFDYIEIGRRIMLSAANDGIDLGETRYLITALVDRCRKHDDKANGLIEYTEACDVWLANEFGIEMLESYEKYLKRYLVELEKLRKKDNTDIKI